MAWKAIIASGIALAVLGATLGPGIAGPIAGVYAMLMVAGGFVRLRSIHGGARLPWTLITVGGVAAVLGGVARTVHASISGVDFPLPSIADALYLPTYVLLGLGQWYFVRARGAGRDPDSWFDAIMASGSVALIGWITIMADYTTDPTVPVSERLVNIGYLIGTTGLLAVTLRVLAAPGVRSVPHYLLSGSILFLWAADMTGNVAYVLGDDPLIITFSLPAIFGLVFGAMWHPDTESLAAEPHDTEPQLGPLRITLLAVSLFVPQLVLVAWASHLDGMALYTSVAATVALDIAALVRVTRLVHAREILVKLADEVRLAGDRLLATVGTVEIEEIAADSVRRVLPTTPAWSGIMTPDGRVLGEIPAEVRATLGAESSTEVRTTLDAATPGREVFATNITSPEGNGPWIAVGSSTQLTRHDRQVLRALANETSMALRGAERAQAVAEAEAERRFTLAIVDSERRQRALLLHSSDIVAVIADDWTIRYISPPVHSTLGYQPVELEGSSLKTMFEDDAIADFERLFAQAIREGSASGEVRVVSRSGEERILQLVLGDHRDAPDIDGLIVNIRDISATRALEEQLDRDPVTGALNRDAFLERVEGHLKHRPSTAGAHGIMIIRLRDLDLVTNAAGYESSDTVLVEVADRLRSNMRIGDDLARIDGHSFAVLADRVLSEADLLDLTSRVRNDVARPLQVGAQLVPIDIHCGAALTPFGQPAASSFARALAAASTAYELATDIEIYQQGIEEGFQLQLELRSRLRAALTDGDFNLHYQPIVSIADQRIRGAEALIRWTHPDRGPVGPNVFIPEAERSGLIVELGDWVLNAAATQLASWRVEGLVDDSFRLAVNVSAGQLQHSLIRSFEKAVSDSGVPAKSIRIELTESMFADDSELAVEVVRALAERGHSIAIDDFGTGTSNLARLGRFPIDVVKIDRSIIAPLETEGAREVELVESTLRLIDGIGASAVAEGIETPTQALILRRLGCELAQGYFYGRPTDAESFSDQFLHSSAHANAH